MTTEFFNPFAGGELLRVAPTTAPQREIIASSQMSEEGNTAFNEAVVLRITGKVDFEQMSRAFDALVMRHDVLRATFSRRGDELCLQASNFSKLKYMDLRGRSTADQNAELQEFYRNIAISPMNLEEGPLVFAWLVQLAEEVFEVVIAVHHVVCDGWSFGIILKDLATLYTADSDTSQLPAAPSFFDFAEAQDAKQIVNKDIDFWRAQFSTTPAQLDLPIDGARPRQRTFQAKRYDYQLSTSVASRLPKTAARMKASVVNLVFSAYFALLHRLTQNEEIIVGLPVAGQSALDQRNLVGHLVQLLPIRVFVGAENTFEALLKQVKEQVLTASEHANFTFGELIEGMKVDRTRVPLITTLFNIDQRMPDLHFGEARAKVSTIPRAAENFEMFLNVVPTEGNLIIEATYSSALFSETTIISWLQSLEAILAAVLDDPLIKVRELRLADAVPAIVDANNQTAHAGEHLTQVHAFEAQVAKTPNKTALVFGDVSMNYVELSRAVNALAAVLRESGVAAGDVVGICCERSHKLVVSALAIQKLGAAYLPLDPEFPADRLRFMVDDSGATLVIRDSAAPATIAEANVKHLVWPALDSLPAPEIANAATQSGLAYIIYTSGSTGTPKGVEIAHASLINFLESMAREPGCNAQDVLLAVTTLAFDISILELFLPLTIGATVVIAAQTDLKDGEKLAQLLERHVVTLMQATPSTWKVLLASRWSKSTAKPLLKALCGGEPLNTDLAEALLPHVQSLWNMFGPTETTVWSTCKQITDLGSPITVGTPIANTQVYVVDAQLNPLPLSAPGEVVIGGKGVAIGYHGRPELTQERFVTHPQFGRIYRTGDLGKWLPNGELQHLGRMDDQVKLRGYRIELGEIEAALVNTGEVRAAAAYLWTPTPDDVRLVACCVPTSSEPIKTVEVRKKLLKALPSYMIPQYFISVDHIPLTPNLKVNRRALPRPQIEESAILSEGTLNNDTERLLARIWTELIKPQRTIGRDDNFFDLGGHSLLALEAIRRIESETKITLGIHVLITQKLATIAETVSKTDARDASAKPAGPVVLATGAVRHPSPEQKRILRHQRLNPASSMYNLQAAWRLRGPLNVSGFTQAFKRVCERQTALRTVVVGASDDPVLKLLRTEDLQLPEWIDVSMAADPFEQALEEADALCAQPFQPFDTQLFRARVFKLAQDDHLLLFIPHLLVFDGWSFDIFLREMESFYQAQVTGNTTRLEHLSLEFRDFAEWCNDKQLERSNPATLGFFRQMLDAANPFASLDNKHAKNQCVRKQWVLGEQELQIFERFCEQHSLRHHEVLFTCYAKALQDVTGAAKFNIGFPVTGRYTPSVIGLVGNFVSILPCEIQTPKTSILTLAKQLAAQLKTFHDHQGASFADVVQSTEWDGKPVADMVTTSFGFQDVRNRPRALASLELAQIDMPRFETEIPIEFWTRIKHGEINAVFDFNAARISADTINSLGEAFSQTLRTLHLQKDEPEVEPQQAQPASKPSLWRRLFK